MNAHVLSCNYQHAPQHDRHASKCRRLLKAWLIVDMRWKLCVSVDVSTRKEAVQHVERPAMISRFDSSWVLTCEVVLVGTPLGTRVVLAVAVCVHPGILLCPCGL